jgi:Protein of unknown function (DUF3014)
MSRYDRNRNKQSNKTTFIFAILVSLLIGISGTYYVMEHFKRQKTAEILGLGGANPKETAVSEKIPNIQQNSLEKGGEPLPVPVAKQTLPTNSVDFINQKSALPDLLSSDAFVRQMLVKLSPGLNQWLGTDQLIRRYMLITNDFSQGLRISKHMSFLRFDEPLTVAQGENGLYIAPKSFQRYNNLALAIQAINAQTAMAVYKKFRPLLLQVFAEFNYPRDINLESIIKKAAGEIIATPVLEGQIAVVRPSLYYKFADPKLEALNSVQKQMIRMGSEHTKIIQSKCREFLVELGKSSFN